MKEEVSMVARVNHQEVVAALLESKAIDFDAIGATVAKLGPQLAVADEPWESFCLTMRMMIWVYRIPGPRGPGLDDLGALREHSSELRS
jgi:hypothetical protein